MEMEPAGPSAKKMKLAASSRTEAAATSPAPAATEANDPKLPTTTVGSQEPPPGADEESGEVILDRISDLPDALLGEIIPLLRIREGVRTQALASRWRHVWRTTPLDLHFPSLPVHNEDILPGVILSTHEGPVHRLCLPARLLHQQPDVVDAWLRSPPLDHLLELKFYLSCYHCTGSQPLLPPPPESMFRFSSTLCVAAIGGCSLPDHTVDTLIFPQLRKLALMAVRISEHSLHKIIATGCPGLECFLLDTCFGCHRLVINSRSVRSIGIRSCSQELAIEDAPSLLRLVHYGISIGMQVTVVSAPKLETLGYVSEWFRDSHIVYGSTFVIQGLHIDSLKTLVSTVKILAINICIFDPDMAIDLMTCFPCLEKLYIKRGRSGNPDLWFQKHPSLLRSLDIRLKILVIGCYEGNRAQVNFASFLMFNARVLESIKLEVDFGDYNDDFFAKHNRILHMEMRVSRGARLCFTRNCFHDISTTIPLNELDLADPFACRC